MKGFRISVFNHTSMSNDKDSAIANNTTGFMSKRDKLLNSKRNKLVLNS